MSNSRSTRQRKEEILLHGLRCRFAPIRFVPFTRVPLAVSAYGYLIAEPHPTDDTGKPLVWRFLHFREPDGQHICSLGDLPGAARPRHAGAPQRPAGMHNGSSSLRKASAEIPVRAITTVLAAARRQSPVKDPFVSPRTQNKIIRAAETIAEQLDRFSMATSSASPFKTMASLARGCEARICGLFAIFPWI